MKLLRDVLGLTSLGGSFALIFVVVSSLTAEDVFGRPDKLAISIGGLIGIGVGLIGMILDLNLASDVPQQERDIWTARLWWLGPLAAAWYFLGKRSRSIKAA